MGVTVPSLKELGSFEVAKLFWNIPFRSELSQLNELYDDKDRSWEIRLKHYREEAKCNVNGYIAAGNLPVCFKNTINSNILSVHKAYLQLFSWKITYDPENRIELFQHDEHYAPNNFTLDGEFNDLVWTKRFVLDAKCSLIDRLNLACCYWFENDIENLWSEIRSSYIASYGDNYDVFQGEFLKNFKHNSAFIKRRLSNNHLQEAEDSLWTFELEDSCEKGYEHSIYFIWQKMSLFQKTSLMENDDFFELLSNATHYPRDKTAFFLYSQLSDVRKIDLLHWSAENENSEIWCALLTAPCAKKIHNEILKFFRHLEIVNVIDILVALVYRIKQHKFFSDKIMFEVLWRCLDPFNRKFVIQNCIIIPILALSKSFFNLRSIIKSLSCKQKQNCLINNAYGAGTDTLLVLVEGGDFDFFQEYLYLFLTDYSCIHNKRFHCIHDKKFPCIFRKCILCTPKKTFFKNANSFFAKFLRSTEFVFWRDFTISEAEKEKVNEIIERIDASLTLSTLQTSVR